MINSCGPALSWRVVHDGTLVLDCFQSTGITETMNTIFEAQSLQECDAEIARLGLIQVLPAEVA